MGNQCQTPRRCLNVGAWRFSGAWSWEAYLVSMKERAATVSTISLLMSIEYEGCDLLGVCGQAHCKVTTNHKEFVLRVVGFKVFWDLVHVAVLLERANKLVSGYCQLRFEVREPENAGYR